MSHLPFDLQVCRKQDTGKTVVDVDYNGITMKL